MKNVYISGAISGHEEEVKRYFMDAEEAVMQRFPGCRVFNPIRLPKMPSWEHYMKICRMRVSGWAEKIVFIENEYFAGSRGAAEERELAEKAALEMYVFRNGKIEEAATNGI